MIFPVDADRFRNQL